MLAAATILATAACERAETPQPADPAPAAPAAETPAPASALTDPQIAAIVVAANEADVQAAEVARERASAAEVRQFAERMIGDHNSLNERAGQLVQRLGVTPQENETSEELRQGGRETVERLRGLSGTEFDRAYIEHEIAFHEQVLDAIDATLIPDADNAELESLLREARPIIAGHLEHARQVQSQLTGS